MATGVQPRDEESKLSRADLEAIQDAMKSKKFRDLLGEYCEEIRDPANQAIYQKEMTQLEKERGYDVTFINPKGGYVIKTSVAGDRKAFINICSSDTVEKPSCKVQEKDGQKGMNWQIPYSIIPPRNDIDSKRQRCVIYDVVFHPDTLRMAEVNKRFRELVNNTALDGLQNTYNIHFDSNNRRFPKSFYKGMTTSAVIRKEDPNFIPPDLEEQQGMSPEMIEKLYPQQVYTKEEKPIEEKIGNLHKQHKKKAKTSKNEFNHCSENGYTVPKYVIKQQKSVDLQDYTYHKDSKQYSAVPSHIILEINLPMLSSTKDCVLDVREKSLKLTSEKPAKYKLELTLPYSVNDQNGSATFDKTKHMLIVTLPVIRHSVINDIPLIRSDSGIDSENNSYDEEEPITSLVEEISSVTMEPSCTLSNDAKEVNEEFLSASIGYILPNYTFNVLDNIIAFTFHVKNTEPESLLVKRDSRKIFMKFSSIGSGFVPIHYAAIILFKEDMEFEDVSGEAWDNNVILQLELKTNVPESFQIGLSETDMKEEYFDLSQASKTVASSISSNDVTAQEDVVPVVEVTNLGSETNIVVSSKKEIEEAKDEVEDEIVWDDSINCDHSAKSILRKPISMLRSFSESSTGDVASSMDYISSDCIPEESSYKKTVRFNDVIARQFYRYNSSIEGQKRKNQRKKSKKRSLERRKSESEAEDDTSNSVQTYTPRLKSALKQRHDSGLADTSDAEAECKTTMSDSDITYENIKYKNENNNDSVNKSEILVLDNNDNNETSKSALCNTLDTGCSEKRKPNPGSKPTTCDNIKHNTDLYNPDKLNKGQYLEVMFKNDLIFDLDM